MSKATAVSEVTNGAEDQIDFQAPYIAEIKVQGTAPFLFHRWNVEAVEEKSKAAKGSKAKKEDNLESYVYRDAGGDLSIPAEYFRMACIHAAKYKQDPRSPRKSAMDLFKAGVCPVDEHCSLGVRDWSYIDKRRVTVQRNGITRSRPAVTPWSCTVQLQVLTPEYITPELLNETIQMAGRLVGVGDFRPTYGRFQVVGFRVS
jgi:hypothetical protein